MAEKEAVMARQEEEKADHHRKAKSEKRAQKNIQKGLRAGQKRKAEQDAYNNEWNETSGT